MSCKCKGSCKDKSCKCGGKCKKEPGHECKCKKVKTTPSVKANRK